MDPGARGGVSAGWEEESLCVRLLSLSVIAKTVCIAECAVIYVSFFFFTGIQLLSV